MNNISYHQFLSVDPVEASSRPSVHFSRAKKLSHSLIMGEEEVVEEGTYLPASREIRKKK